MAGKRAGKIARSYQSSVIGPLVKRIEKAKSLKKLLAALGPGLLTDMKTDALEEALTETTVQAALVGRTSALPGRQTSKRQTVKTSKGRS